MKKLLLLLLMLPLTMSAQRYNKGAPCDRYKTYVQHISNDATVIDPILKSAADFSINPVVDQAILTQLQAKAECEIEYFINTKARNKKIKEQLQEGYTILGQKLYKTSDNIVIGIQKTVTGNSYKIYSNTLIIIDGTTLHSYTDYSEVDFNITLFGADKVGERYLLYGEEEANQGSMYYGRFTMEFTPQKRLLSYELHLKA
ncbi:hypothetical protein [Pontibacter pudoricolor]|uniref:hypothetical protein n=1 Tax=Pontibacter pudoricolor TaxID=2694930 RepID=UPI0013917196|nr:hypothetical protein [Pontibacter pudoricolor]